MTQDKPLNEKREPLSNKMVIYYEDDVREAVKKLKEWLIVEGFSYRSTKDIKECIDEVFGKEILE